MPFSNQYHVFLSEKDATKQETIDSIAETSSNKKISLKDLKLELKKENESSSNEQSDNSNHNSDKDDDDDSDIDVNKLYSKDFAKIIDEENNALDELHTILNKTRQKIIKFKTEDEQILAVSSNNELTEKSQNGVSLDQLNTIDEQNEDEDMMNGVTKTSLVVLDSLSEFCKNIGSSSSGARRTNIYESDNEDDDAKEEKMDTKPRNKKDDSSSSSSVDESMEDENENETNKTGEMESSADEKDLEDGVLDDEPALNRGLASALKLAMSKGYIAEEKSKSGARMSAKAAADLTVKNYTIEERSYYDIDAKYDRNRDRFSSGPLADFSEKRDYKPDVKLTYIDERGHNMNEKEAFRYLSHKFHGKGSGKKKTEKRLKKDQESELMKKMSSGDTPLNTVSLLIEKQKQTQQAFVILSAPKGGKSDQISLHKR
jgi:U4/U6.U5 tri-snRNP-associated protein 1